MRVFITGSTGFVGRHVIREICAGKNEVLALRYIDEQQEAEALGVQDICGDLGDIEPLKTAIRSFNPETVIHLAWQGIPDYSEVISRINLNNSIQLLDFIMDETDCQKMIISGSCFEYGKNKGVCREADPVQLGSFFSWAKYSLYRYLLLKCEQKETDLNWFRIFYVYGPEQRKGSLIPTLVQALKEGEIPDIRSPQNKNDFVYIEDIAKAFRLAVERNVETGIYNLGSGISRSVYEVCRIVEECLQVDRDISNDILKNGPKESTVDFWCDTEKTTRCLGWRYGVTLEEGIARYIGSL
jgi:UDP-glucose 4-epimerase